MERSLQQAPNTARPDRRQEPYLERHLPLPSHAGVPRQRNFGIFRGDLCRRDFQRPSHRNGEDPGEQYPLECRARHEALLQRRPGAPPVREIPGGVERGR
ncbi:hypothetical protein PIB30_051142 [Stylosanthes scabra]|uniref:Uncharacterized protein n=1 Tax=Stylosanthes scabra TaxID=79078 RepID=A0ABU6QHI4_9FABA|nr:hypothetical protein [Stylosanthes scabra]